MSAVDKKFTFSVVGEVLVDGQKIAGASVEYSGLDYEQLLEMENMFFVRPLNELHEMGREQLKQKGSPGK